MNILSFFIIVLNASLLAGALGGIFVDIPLRGDLSNKVRVQTTVMQSVSERDAEMIVINKKIADLEKENPSLPLEIQEAKENLEAQSLSLSNKMKQLNKATSTLAALQKQNAIKEKEMKKQLSLKVIEATSSSDEIPMENATTTK